MNPTATLRLRRITAIIAIGWALLAFVHNVAGQLWFGTAPEWPLEVSGIGGVAIVQGVSARARQMGVEPGDRLLFLDHQPVMRVARRSKGFLAK